jgi:hypothetical protein
MFITASLKLGIEVGPGQAAEHDVALRDAEVLEPSVEVLGITEELLGRRGLVSQRIE